MKRIGISMLVFLFCLVVPAWPQAQATNQGSSTVWVAPPNGEDDTAKYVLKKYREDIKPKDSDYILAGERRGAPLNLHNLASRFIKPAIQKYNA